MKGYEIKINVPVKYEYTGKFQAQSSDWKHNVAILNNYELIVMTEGTLYLSYGGVDYTVTKGEYLFLPPLEPAAFRRGFKASYSSFYWLHFAVEHEPVFNNMEAVNTEELKSEQKVLIPETGKLSHPDKIIVLMKQLQDFIRSSYDALAADYMSTTILCELYHQAFQEKQSVMERHFSKRQVYFDIVDYIGRNTYDNLKVSDIADHFGYNEKYLTRMFRNVAGISLKQFVLQKKMEEVNYLLTDTNRTVSEISETLGFGDSHNFMKAYKKIIGLTPTEYRNAYAKRMLFHE